MLPHHLRTKPEEAAPPVVLLRPLTRAVLRWLLSQFSRELRPTFEILGGRAGLLFFRDEGSSSTRMVTSPIFKSLGGLSTLSRNLSLFGFLVRLSSSAGGVGGLAAGAAFRISSGSSAGRACRRESCVVDPWRVSVLSDTKSSPG